MSINRREEEKKSMKTLLEKFGNVKRETLLEEHEELMGKIPTIVEFTRNSPRNRFPNVALFDHSRVVLSPLLKNDTDYIHASWVEEEFILTQSPLPQTQTDFWRMVWKEDVKVIVSFNTMESGIDSEQAFWPTERSQKLKSGKFEIQNDTDRRTSDNPPDHFHKAQLKIRFKPTKTERCLSVLNYRRWNETGVPDTTILPLLDAMWEHQGAHKGLGAGSESSSPIIIQCNTGARRSGIFTALAIASREMLETGQVRVKETAQKIRQARYGCIQSAVQYGQIYYLLVEYAKLKKEISPHDPAYKAFASAFQSTEVEKRRSS